MEPDERTTPPLSHLAESGRELVSLAAERTLLTWIRAAITLMVLGFAVDRFGLLLARGDGEAAHLAGSFWVGVALMMTGVLTSVVAALRYRRYARGDAPPGSGLSLAIALALLVALAGSGLAVYLWIAAF
jgi:putative membrane protein